jgi:PleD family two-component response regulator
MGGSVVLHRSAPGEGSCFRLELPLVPAEGAALASSLQMRSAEHRVEASGTAPRLAGRILLAEDGPDNQRLISFHLRRAGAVVDVAENGRIALERMEAAALEGRPYDLLLTDMQMPEVDGYTLARTLRARGATLPIVALTAHAMS